MWKEINVLKTCAVISVTIIAEYSVLEILTLFANIGSYSKTYYLKK